jgi:hypothetical protein
MPGPYPERHATDAELQTLYDLTHDWVIGNGMATPSLGFQGFAPDGYPIVDENSSFMIAAPAWKIGKLEPEAVGRLGLGSTGRLTVSVFEPAYVANEDQPVDKLPLDEPTLTFLAHHRLLAPLRSASYMMTKTESGAMAAAVNYEPRVWRRKPPASPIDRILEEDANTIEGIPYGNYADLSLIMHAWQRNGPAIRLFSRRHRKQ